MSIFDFNMNKHILFINNRNRNFLKQTVLSQYHTCYFPYELLLVYITKSQNTFRPGENVLVMLAQNIKHKLGNFCECEKSVECNST